MAKFKVGDRVKVDSSKYPQYYSATGTITLIWHDKFDNYSYNIDFQKSNLMANNIPEKWLELVEPIVFHKPSYAKEYWYNINGDFSYLGFLREWSFDTKTLVYKMSFINPKKPVGVNHSTAEFQKNNYKKHLFTTSEKELYEKNAKIKQAFERKPIFFSEWTKTDMDKEFPYYHFSLTDDALDAIKYALPPKLDYQKHILGVRTNDNPKGRIVLWKKDEALIKNRIPDRVVFNQDKGKVTVLISKHLDGVAPYFAYTSKVHGDDEYSGYFGFFLSYYKYLNRHLDGATRKELIDMAFEHGEHKEYIIEGAVSQEVMKLVKIDEWDNILTAILEVSKQNKGYWDYAEWKEMLRVHELELKREHEKEVRKQIKAHEKEIEKLKQKKGV